MDETNSSPFRERVYSGSGAAVMKTVGNEITLARRTMLICLVRMGMKGFEQEESGEGRLLFMLPGMVEGTPDSAAWAGGFGIVDLRPGQHVVESGPEGSTRTFPKDLTPYTLADNPRKMIRSAGQHKSHTQPSSDEATPLEWMIQPAVSGKSHI